MFCIIQIWFNMRCNALDMYSVCAHTKDLLQSIMNKLSNVSLSTFYSPTHILMFFCMRITRDERAGPTITILACFLFSCLPLTNLSFIAHYYHHHGIHQNDHRHCNEISLIIIDLCGHVCVYQLYVCCCRWGRFSAEIRTADDYRTAVTV